VDMEDLKEIWLFLKERKKWWLTPIIITLILLALLVFAGSSTTVAPFCIHILLESHFENLSVQLNNKK
jgi:predicted cobalt transporter CbtA